MEPTTAVLRRFTPDDLELVVELDGDPQVKRYIDGGLRVDRRELVETLQWWLGYYDRGERYGFWAAIEKSSGRFIGWFHLRPGEGAGPLEPELGYRLRRDAWGQGYATEGSRALIDKAFATKFTESFTPATLLITADPAQLGQLLAPLQKAVGVKPDADPFLSPITVATVPQVGSQIRQKVTCSVIGSGSQLLPELWSQSSTPWS